MPFNADPFGWVGAIIDGKFRVDEFIEQGGFGAVYRGFHLGLRKPIAIKCIKVPHGFDDTHRTTLEERLLAEAHRLHELSTQTAGIVQVLDIGSATSPPPFRQRTPYIVMEWLTGKTLRTEIEERSQRGDGPRGIEEAFRLLTPAAEALAVAHRNGVFHRDIKPGNLFLIQSPDGPRMKVLDFGIAKVMSQATSITRSTLGAFTAPYGTPEQFNDAHGLTSTATDVFAMVLTLLEVASGKCVLQGGNFMELYHSACGAHARKGLFRGVAAEDSHVARVLRRALDPSPARRHRDMGELWADLEYAIGVMGESRRTPAPPPVSHAPQNRVCTVLLVHLTDMHALLARREPDEVTEIVDRFMAVVTDQARRFGAVVQRTAPDRAFVSFGALSRMDKHPEQAVVAALRGLHALRAAAPPRGGDGSASAEAQLSAVIAINTGRVFVRTDPLKGLTVIGDPVSVAEHLLKAARPGGIVIGRDTYQMVANHFNVEPLAPLSVPNHDEPLLWYRVKGTIAFKASFASTDFHGIKTKLVGRDLEQRQIRGALEGMVSRQKAQLVTLLGPPGLGRSRLLADFFSHLATTKENVLVLSGLCSPIFADTSYSLAAALLRQRFGLDERDLPRQIERKLRVGMRWFRVRWMTRRRSMEDSIPPLPVLEEPMDSAAIAEALQHSSWILGHAETELHVDPGSLDDSKTQMKKRTTDAVLRLARFFTRRLPLVIICDDLQWADDASLDLLEALVRRDENLPVLIVASAHPELRDRRPEWGRSAERSQLIELDPLRNSDIEEMIRDRLRQIPDLSTDLLRTLAGRAEGNPLILKETLDYLVDTGVIEVHRDHPWALHAQPGALRLPATIQEMVQARLDRLEADAHEVLVHAAVVGRSFLHGAVDHLRRAGGGAQMRSTDVILQQLRNRRLISALTTTIPGEPESMFVEAATCEVAYQTLVARDRRAQHQLVAGWLEGRANIPAVAALLAYHYDQAGDEANAAAAYMRAAAYATSLGDTAAALRHLERARAIHDEAIGKGAQDTGKERRIAAFPDRVLLRLDLGDTLRRAGRLDEAERSYTEARKLLLLAERRSGAGIPRSDVLRWEAYIDARFALLHLLRGALPEARELLERAIKHATEVGAGADLAEMYRNLAEAELGCGQLGAAIEAAERALGIAEEHGRVFLGDVALTLVRALVRAKLMGADLGPRVKTAVAALEASLAKHFDTDDLREKAAECRAMLERVGLR